VEWLVGVARALRLPASTSATALVGALRGLGQVPFDPPNVGGWPAGQAWLSTASADLRLRTATALARAGDLATVTDAASGDRIDAAGYLLGIGAWSDRSVAALRPSVGDPRQLVAIAANTPEYLVH
ncbi:MAG: DUF1800 family protein, partial [Actinobacteria bacterium]|nr:DUF1800 family protein [Actinomycetota bacterium]